MATQITQAQFSGLVNAWERRLRLQQTVYWLPRSVIPGLVMGIVLAIYSRVRPGLSNTQILLVTAIITVAGLLGMLAYTWLRPRRVLESARHFDRNFGLQERVSTALELIEGKIRADESLADRQVADAWEAASSIRTENHLPLIVERRDWALVAGLVAVLAALLLFFTPVAAVDSEVEQQRAAIEEAEEILKDIIEDVAADPNLREENRQELLEALEANLETLGDDEITAEEAFATLSEAESSLKEQAQTLEQELQADQSALAAASEALQVTTPEAAEAQTAQQSLEALMNALENMSAEELAQAAQALQEAADALQQTSPEAAQALQQAAQALQQGNTQEAQQALENAMQQLQQAQQQAQQAQQAAQNLQQNAQNAQQAGQQVAGQQQQGQQGQQNQQGQQGQQGQQSGQEGQQSGQQGQQGQEGQSGQQGQQAGQEGQQPGGQQGQQPGQQGQAGQEGQENMQGQQAGSGSGAGDAQGNPNPTSSNGQSGNDSRDNNPDGQGVGEYDTIYAPRSIEGGGDDEIRLQADPDDTPLQEGEFSNNPEGQVTVPYNEVFSDYANSVNRALDTDYIPLGLRDVIRDYFTSLDPQR